MSCDSGPRAWPEYALNHVSRLVGKLMIIDINEQAVLNYQSARLKEKASPKSINEKVGSLLRILANRGDALRARLRRRKQLKLKVRKIVGRAFSAEEKTLRYEQALKRRSRQSILRSFLR